MPLDSTIYPLSLLRTDGRRWNELRHMHAVIRTKDATDGSSYLEMGHTKVMCVVNGPNEGKKNIQSGGEARVEVSIVVAGFSGVDRKKRARNDRRTSEMEAIVVNAVSATVHTHLFPHSTITISLYLLSSDGSVLSALLNATTLALVDAGIPMSSYLASCTTGSTSTYAAADDTADPLLDLNGAEETELPFVTVGTIGDGDGVVVLVGESRMQVERLEGLLAVGVDGCKQVRKFLDGVVKEKGNQMVKEGAVDRGAVVEQGE